MTRFLALLALALFLSTAAAAPSVPARERDLWAMPGFLYAHPDVKYRKLGFWHLEQNETEQALASFRKAARFGDKASQAMLAEMYWSGERVSADRPQAYAWMDLAAERGYAMFLVRREALWEQLSLAEQARALDVGGPLYAEYGDDVAKPRLKSWLARATRGSSSPTGSHLGALGAVRIIPATPLNADVTRGPHALGFSISGDTYYHRKFWFPERYFEWTDSIWVDMPEGEVEVGELRAKDR